MWRRRKQQGSGSVILSKRFLRSEVPALSRMSGRTARSVLEPALSKRKRAKGRFVRRNKRDWFASLFLDAPQLSVMKYVLIILAVFGIAVSSLALREHYRTEGDSPCSINERWDCGIVNKSPYAMIGPIPVAVIGIVGYLLMGVLAWRRAYRILLAVTLAGLGFSLYLAHIEAHVLGVWCVYCVISLGIISLLTLLALVLALWSAKPTARANP
jgi:vitamin-K-epoxide reductase (warfarin-sensitive)